MSLTGIKDLDRELLLKVDSKELLKVCLINKYMWNTVCDDVFLKRILMKYPHIEQYKRENETWKFFFSRVIYYIELLKEYDYEYTFGNFEKQYNIFKETNGTTGNLLFSEDILLKASRVGELDLVIWSLKSSLNIIGYALNFAAKEGHYEIVKYLTEYNGGINVEYKNRALIYAVRNRRYKIVKYLVEQGADATEAMNWTEDEKILDILKGNSLKL